MSEPDWEPRDSWGEDACDTFTEIATDTELDASHAAQLYQACDLIDLADKHTEIAQAAGWVAVGSQGQLVEHPLSASARSARANAARIIGTLAGNAGRGSRTTSTSARAASRARWGTPGTRRETA
jgi:hypothetical protein